MVKEVAGENLKKERKARLAKVQKAVLFALAAAGGISMALVAPNALQVLEQFGWIQTKRKPRYTINTSVERLLRKGLLKRDERNFLMLTPKGKRRLFEIRISEYHLEKPARWDKKWRLVSFDIREKRREIRDQLRQALTSVGFVRVHQSLWVYPYECQDFITLLKADFEVGKDILYIISDRIENDGWLRRHFDL